MGTYSSLGCMDSVTKLPSSSDWTESNRPWNETSISEGINGAFNWSACKACWTHCKNSLRVGGIDLAFRINILKPPLDVRLLWQRRGQTVLFYKARCLVSHQGTNQDTQLGQSPSWPCMYDEAPDTTLAPLVTKNLHQTHPNWSFANGQQIAILAVKIVIKCPNVHSL